MGGLTMTKYIECKAVFALIRPDDPNDERCAVTVATAKRLIRHALAVAPAADVAPVTRCKDCKHKGWVQEPCHGKSVDYCKVWDCTLRNLETTFCSYGERKDGGDG